MARLLPLTLASSSQQLTGPGMRLYQGYNCNRNGFNRKQIVRF